MESWDWRYGRTPKFNITIKSNETSVVLSVKNGVIENVTTPCNLRLTKLINNKFDMNIVKEIKNSVKNIKR